MKKILNKSKEYYINYYLDVLKTSLDYSELVTHIHPLLHYYKNSLEELNYSPIEFKIHLEESKPKFNSLIEQLEWYEKTLETKL